MAADKVTIIAEIGVNHNGSLNLAKELVARAAEAGADYAKFQTFSAAELASPAAEVANYQQKAFSGSRQRDLLASLELREADFEELISYCRQAKIGFLTTAHDLKSAHFVFGLDSNFIKVPSGDITNLPFLRLVAQQRAHVLLSTGASEEAEVGAAIDALESSGKPRADMTVMQCTTEYPAPVDEANLLAMVEMGSLFGVGIGYSDHTLGHEAAIAAVALGCTVLEKHITLDRTMEGPDHSASLEPLQFTEMVLALRSVEAALGGKSKVVTTSEAGNREVIRKSIVATRPISAGETMTEHNLGLMRPGRGVSPMQWDRVVGYPARRAYELNDPIDLP